MDHAADRAALVSCGRRLDALGFAPATDGNVSVRLGPRAFLVTPAGREKGGLSPDELLLVDLEGAVVEGEGRPSTETPMHLLCYRRRGDVGGVVHAHPPVATAFAAAGVSLDAPVIPEIVLTVGTIPLVPYATPGTEELARALEPFVDDHDAFLLASHGVLTLGRDVREALHRMERVEHLAKVTLAARLLGGPRPLTDAQVVSLFSGGVSPSM
ncbi:MAG: class II aldolase/adducin family protein [Holophagales bacterium]|jgi:L-fuculose-phosphate aldolase|nr:class II aldolase/adducin family protein [Holophagales bacterium]MBK9966776.1 class II aldolase/adducin family protein [Holophagales bacterium]